MMHQDIILECGGGWLPRSKSRTLNRLQAAKAITDLRTIANGMRTTGEVFRYNEEEKEALGVARCHIHKAIWQIQKLLNNGK